MMESIPGGVVFASDDTHNNDAEGYIVRDELVSPVLAFAELNCNEKVKY